MQWFSVSEIICVIAFLILQGKKNTLHNIQTTMQQNKKIKDKKMRKTNRAIEDRDILDGSKCCKNFISIFISAASLCLHLIFFCISDLNKHQEALVSFTTTPLNAKSAIIFESAIRPLKISAIVHTAATVMMVQ